MIYVDAFKLSEGFKPFPACVNVSGSSKIDNNHFTWFNHHKT